MSLYSTLILLVGAIFAAIIVYVQYKDYFFEQRLKASILGSLRWLSYMTILLLLINFPIETETTSTEKQKLILLTDISSSMNNFTSEDKVSNLINSITTNSKLQDKFTIEKYGFGESFQRLEDEFVFADKQTNIAKALREIDQVYKNQKYSIVLVSDGNQSIGQEYTYLAKQLNQTIYPIVVGDTAKVEDLRIDRLNVNKYVFLDNKFPVEVFASYQGEKEQYTEVGIFRNSKQIASKNVVFSSSKSTHRVTFELPANEKGLQKYQIRVRPFEGESFIENNTKDFAIEVIDDYSNILLFTEKIHPDIGMLQRSISKSQQRKVTVKTLTELDEVINDFNLLVLYQPTNSFQSVIQQANDFGMNVLVFSGTKTDYAFLQKSFPYFEKSNSNVTEDYYPIFDQDFSVFQQEDFGFNQLPPLQDVFGDVRLTTEAQVLLKQQVQGFETGSPLLFFVEDKSRRFGFFMGENSWRWRSQYFVDNQSFDAFDDFIGNMLQYVTSTTTKQRLVLDYERFYNQKLDEEIKAFYYDANFKIDNSAEVTIQLKNEEDGSKNEYPMLWRGNYYSFPIRNLDNGSYSIEVSVNDRSFVSSGSFQLEEQDVEDKVISPDVASLTSIANGNRLYLLNESDVLMQHLSEESSLSPSLKSVKKNLSLIDWFYLLLFLVVTLSLEWFIRKYNGLI